MKAVDGLGADRKTMVVASSRPVRRVSHPRPLRIRSSNWLRRSIRVRRRLCLRRCARRSAGHWLIRPVRRPVASDLTANRAAVASKPPADLGLRDTAAKQPVDLVALPFLELFIMLSHRNAFLRRRTWFLNLPQTFWRRSSGKTKR